MVFAFRPRARVAAHVAPSCTARWCPQKNSGNCRICRLPELLGDSRAARAGTAGRQGTARSNVPITRRRRGKEGRPGLEPGSRGSRRPAGLCRLADHPSWPMRPSALEYTGQHVTELAHEEHAQQFRWYLLARPPLRYARTPRASVHAACRHKFGTQSVQVVRNFGTWSSCRSAIICSTSDGTRRTGVEVVWA
jgi:hypothetical protein